HGVHLVLTGVEARDGHLHMVPVDHNKDRHFRLSINVEELWKDLDALFERLEAKLRADPDLAAKVQKRAAAARLGDTNRIQPEGPALEVWRAYLRSARWEGPQPPPGGWACPPLPFWLRWRRLDPTRLTIEGYYTPQDGLIAVGVTACQSVSDWPVKRQAELLGMRTAFIDWFLLQA